MSRSKTYAIKEQLTDPHAMLSSADTCGFSKENRENDRITDNSGLDDLSYHEAPISTDSMVTGSISTKPSNRSIGGREAAAVEWQTNPREWTRFGLVPGVGIEYEIGIVTSYQECIHTYTHTHIYIHTYISISIYTHTYIHIIIALSKLRDE